MLAVDGAKAAVDVMDEFSHFAYRSHAPRKSAP
jgi:hypothetical protein